MTPLGFEKGPLGFKKGDRGSENAHWGSEMAHWGSEETRWCSKEKGHKDAKKAHWGFEKSHRGLKDPIRLRKGALGLGINCLSKTPSPAWKSFEHALPCSEKGFENAQGSSSLLSSQSIRRMLSKKLFEETSSDSRCSVSLHCTPLNAVH